MDDLSLARDTGDSFDTIELKGSSVRLFGACERGREEGERERERD